MVPLLPQSWRWRVPSIVPFFLAGLLFLAPPVPDGQEARFASGVDLVEVYATVVDADGEPLVGLTVADFQVAEDLVPQPITAFAAGEFPLSVTIALDRSFSMAGEKLTRSTQAARSFVAALGPSDEVAVVAIGSGVETVSPPVPAAELAPTLWNGIVAWGTTPLYDAGVQALDAIQARRGRRALLLISDGSDGDSEASAAELIARARQSGVLVYPIAIGGTRPPVFGELASATGGRSFFVGDPKQLEARLAALARELRSQYLLGYVPSRAAAGDSRWRSIRVTVSRPDAVVRARDGYYSR